MQSDAQRRSYVKETLQEMHAAGGCTEELWVQHIKPKLR